MAETHQRAERVLGLFDLYYERVYGFLRKSTTPDVAEDLAQEVFLRLLQHPELDRLTISISYLLKIAHNLLRRRYARASRLRELLEERAHIDAIRAEPEAPMPERLAPPVRHGRGDIERDVLDTALGLLGKDEQDAVRLIVCEGKSYQHAAEALGVSVTTINNWKHRGIIKLRRLVGGSMDASIPESPDEVIGLTRAPSAANRAGRERVDLSADRAPRAGRRRGERFAPDDAGESRAADPRRPRGQTSLEGYPGEERREGA
jgi:RNA polymerase sigma-70 factor (ECF subfamily)